MSFKSVIKKVVFVCLLTGCLFAAGRIYYAVTAGFSLKNITAELPYEKRWDIHELSAGEKHAVEEALEQEYTYLGKGCQAYVFASHDGQYVIKFFKYQRFRPQEWINAFAFIPAVADYQKNKAVEKKHKLDKVFTSWKLAFENLKDETGVVYVHLNKTPEWQKNLVIKDKIGRRHSIDLGQTEFLLQKRAVMLCPTIDEFVAKGNLEDADALIDRLLRMLLSEYSRGFADNDHALMQNTGVFNSQPVHIDVGQFIYNDIVKDLKVIKQEMYDKTFKLHQWLVNRYPELAFRLRSRLVALLGIDYFYMAPYVHKGDVGKIPHRQKEPVALGKNTEYGIQNSE